MTAPGDERPELNQAQPHGSIALLPQACTACDICVAECPTWCITLAAHVEEQAPAARGRPRKVKVLDAFAIDFGLCMFCGVCVEVCPFDALAWVPSGVDAAAAPTALVEDLPALAARWPADGLANRT